MERSYRKGTLLIEEGSQGDVLYLLISGRVRVFSADDRGREVIYGFLGPGEYVGEMSLDGGSRCASAITESPCRCVLLTRASLLAHLRESPDFGLALITTLIQRLRAANRSTRQLALNDVYGRLKVLLEDPDLSGHRLTHQAMAQRLGCSREMVSRLIKDLEQGGYLVKAERGRYERVRSLPARW